MFNTEKAIQTFSTKTHVQKLKKLREVYSIVGNKNPILSSIKSYLNNPKLAHTEKILDMFYNIIMWLVNKQQLRGIQNKIAKYQTKLTKLANQEKAQENNQSELDLLLSTL